MAASTIVVASTNSTALARNDGMAAMRNSCIGTTLRDGLETPRASVPAVQQPSLWHAVADAVDRMDRRDDASLRLAPIRAKRAEVHDERDLRRVRVRHGVVAADDLERALGIGRMQRGRERDVMA